MRENNTFKLSVSNPGSVGTLYVHELVLEGLAGWSVHTLLRNKVAIFGNRTELARLDASDSVENSAFKITRDLYGTWGIAELRCVRPCI